MSQEPNTTAEPGVASVDPHSVEGLFVAALGKASPEERAAFLDQACGDDADRRMRVEALLRAYDDAGSFLEKPPAHTTGVVGEDEVRLDFLTPTDKPDRLGTLGHYEVIEVIGRGGMGIVLRAFDPKLNRIVAIKALAPELAANPNARRRFTREAQAAASISHPHIVTIHAVEEEPWPFLVMECVAGQSLQEKLDKAGSLRLTEVLRIGRQIAEGLSAAHKQGLIHRDIKPANILLENGVERVKITDFGLARAVDDVAITRTGEVPGTPQYMSPEQARGERVDQRSDLFSLGCVLYAMCSGRPPFRADSLAGVMHRVINDQPRPLLELNPETPGWLIDIVATLLAKDPEERFQSADEVAAILEEHLAVAQGTSPKSAGAPTVARRHRRQERHAFGGGIDDKDRPHAVSAILMLLSIASFSFAVTRMFSVPYGLLLLATFVLVVGIGGVMVGHWISRRPVRPRGAPTVFAVTALLIGAIAGCPSGWDLFGSFPKEAMSGAAYALGVTTLFASWLLSARHRTRRRSEPGGGLQRPAIVLAWLAVVVVSLVLLLPCVVGVALLVPYFHAQQQPVDTPVPATDDYLRSRSAQTQSAESMMGEGDFSGEAVATGALILKFEDAGLSVELRPLDVSQDDPEGALERPGTVYTESGTFEIPVGDYRPVVDDSEFGWVGEARDDPTLMPGSFSFAGSEGPDMGMSAMPGFASPPRSVGTTYALPKIKVEEGVIATLTVQRDFQALAEHEPDWSRGGLYHFKWSGAEYVLTKPQAKVVNYLLWAYAAGEPEVSPARLSNMFATDEDKSLIESFSEDVPDEFKHLFNDGAHPAWGKLIVTSEAGNTYRLAEPAALSTEDTDAVPASNGTETAAPGPAPQAGAAEIGPKLTIEITRNAYAGDREALVTVDIRDIGLFVALRRKSSFSGEIIGEEQDVSRVGPTVLKLASGTYEVLLRDPTFGWRQDRIDTVEIPEGSVQTFVVERDFSRYSHVDDQFIHSLTHQFAWNGTAFRLTHAQAACVNLMLRRYAEETFTVTGEELLAVARNWTGPFSPEAALSDADVLDQFLASTDGLVVRVADTDEYRLAPAELGTIRVQIEQDGLAVVLSRDEPDFFSDTEVTFSGVTAERLGVSPGQFTVTLYDHKVQWMYWEKPTIPAGEVISSWTLPPITIPRGETNDIDFVRDAEHFRRVADFEIPEEQQNVSFIWFGRQTHEERPGLNVVYPLNRDQVACIRVLLRALADGTPEMTGDQIVVAAGIEGQTFEEVFADYASRFHSSQEVPAGEEQPEEPFEPWPGVIVRGERENTWRLSAPPEDMVSLEVTPREDFDPFGQAPDSDDPEAPINSGPGVSVPPLESAEPE